MFEQTQIFLAIVYASLVEKYEQARKEVYSWSFLRNKKAQVQGGVVGALIGIMVSLLIAIIVIQNLISSQTQSGWSATANTTWTSLQSNIWIAVTLLVIVPIIVGAVIILGYVRRGM